MARRRTRRANGAGSPAGRRANNAGSVYRYPDGRWVARVSAGRDDQGRRIRRTVYAQSQAEAQAELIKLQGHLQRGALSGARGRAPVLKTYLADWLAAHEGDVSPRTALRYRQLIQTHVDPDPIARVQITKLTRDHVKAMLSRRLKTGGIAPRTAAHIRAVLRTALNAAVPDLISFNPAAGAKPPKVPEGEMLTLTSEQVRKLIELGQDHRDGNLWAFLVGSGVRLAEALGLRWDDYDDRAGLLQVKRQLRRQDSRYSLADLKTRGSQRTLRLAAVASTALKRQREQQAAERAEAGDKWTDGEVSMLLIFRTPTGEPMSGTAINHRLHKTLTPTRLPNVRIHDLRHTYATLALASGVPVLEVSRALGHSKATVTLNVYGHSSDEGQEALATAMDRALGR